MFYVYLAAVVACACAVALWIHFFAANRAMYYDRETHFETVKSRQKLLGARVINSFEISRQLDGKSYYYCHYAENHEDGHVADYVFDERGRQVFNAGPHLLKTMLVCNALAIGAFAAVHYDQPARPSAPPQDLAVDRSLLNAACAWRGAYNQALEIEALAPTEYRREFWSGGAPRSVEPLVDGAPHGVARYTFANGALYGEIPWRRGKKHGVFTLYREDGSKEMTLSYRDGHNFGLNQWFAPDGRLSEAWVYLGDDAPVSPALCEPAG